jgi:hypothetical protein
MTETATTNVPANVAGTAGTSDGDEAECWCCSRRYPSERLVRMEDHTEVAVCLRCAHFLHRQASQREDALRPSIAGRVRNGLRSGRRAVVERDWHQRPLIGPPLRWLGRHLP